MITREDITVKDVKEMDGSEYTLIEVTIGDKVYGSSFKSDAARMHAIKNLAEKIMKKEVGIIEHDIMMQVFNFEMERDGK